MIGKITSSLAVKTASFINGSAKAQKILSNISENPAIYSTRASSLVNGVLRPITNIVTAPEGCKMDGIYGASSAVSSSLVELITGTSLMKPFKKCLDKSAEVLINNGYFDKMGSSVNELSNKYKSVNGRLFKISLVPLNTIMKYTVISYIASGIKNGLDMITRKRKYNE